MYQKEVYPPSPQKNSTVRFVGAKHNSVFESIFNYPSFYYVGFNNLLSYQAVQLIIPKGVI